MLAKTWAIEGLAGSTWHCIKWMFAVGCAGCRRCLQGRWAYDRPCARPTLLLETWLEMSVRNGPCQAGHGGSLSGLRQWPPVFRDWVVRIFRFGALFPPFVAPWLPSFMYQRVHAGTATIPRPWMFPSDTDLFRCQ